VWDEEFDVAGGPEITETCAAEMAYETDVWDEDAGEDDEDEWGRPGGDLVGSDTVRSLVVDVWNMGSGGVPEGWIRLVLLHNFGR